MKKKIALLLAAVMIFAAMVPSNLFASTTTTITNTFSNIGIRRTITNNPEYNAHTVAQGIGYNAKTSNVKIQMTSNAAFGDTFTLTLKNGIWMYTPERRTEILEWYNYVNGTNFTALGGASTALGGSAFSNDNFKTYDPAKGVMNGRPWANVITPNYFSNLNVSATAAIAAAQYDRLNDFNFNGTQKISAIQQALADAIVAHVVGTPSDIPGTAPSTVDANTVIYASLTSTGATSTNTATTLGVWALMIAQRVLNEGRIADLNRYLGDYTFTPALGSMTDVSRFIAYDATAKNASATDTVVGTGSVITAFLASTYGSFTHPTTGASTAVTYNQYLTSTIGPADLEPSAPVEALYKMTFDPLDKTKAYVTLLQNMVSGEFVIVPLNVLTTANEIVSVSLGVTNTSSSPFTTFNDYNVVVANAPTSVKFATVVSGRDIVNLDKLIISETIAKTITSGRIALIAPEGTTWMADVAAPNNVRVTNASGFTYVQNDGTLYLPQANAFASAYYPDVYEAGRIAYITLDIGQSSTYAGSLYIEGLRLKVDDNTRFDETMQVGIMGNNVYLEEYVSGTWTAPSWGGYASTISTSVGPTSGAAVWVDAFKRVDYAINFERFSKTAAVPEFYAGDADLGARVRFDENAALSWWSYNQTDFYLVDKDGKSLTDKVKLIAAYRFANNSYTTYWGHTNLNVSTPDVFDDYLRFTATKVDNTRASTLNFTPYISAAADFVGDVYLRATGRGIPAGEELADVHIATILAPAEVSAKTVNVQVGYQTVPVADITVKEAEPQLWGKGYDVSIITQVYGMTPNDVYFIDVKGITLTKNAGDGVLGTVVMDQAPNGALNTMINVPITRASNKVAFDFTLSGLKLYINRSVPEGHYDIAVGGEAFVYNYTPNRLVKNDKSGLFNSFGILLPDYITVATAGLNKALSKNVIISADNSNAIVEGQPYTLEVAPINVNSRLFVNTRYIAVALGLEEKNVLWDDVAKKVVIISAERTVEFYMGTNKMTINGAVVNLTEADGTPIICQIVNERSFVPFRAMGEAFGITVGYNATTGNAYYNPTAEQIAGGASIVK